MSFRFVHTADIHLDSPLRSLALRDTALSDHIGNATRAAFVRIIELCLDEAVDALLIAGDLYDGSQTSMKTARFLAQQLQRLDSAGIATFIIRGNHDAMSRITTELELPASVTVFGGRASVARLEVRGMSIAIHGISFREPHAPQSLIGRFGAPVADAINIGLLHTSLAGAPGHDPYAPCSLAELQATGFDYWALGHVHIRSEVAGRPTVVMPGIPQGRDIGEAGPKSATLVTVAPDGEVTTQTRDTALAVFGRVEVVLDGADDWRGIVGALDAAIRAARRDSPADTLVLRPVLTGATRAAWRLRRDLDLLHHQAVMVAESIGSVWIDKLENLATDARDAPPATGPLADLAQILALSDGAARAAVLAQVEGAAHELLATLPAELRGLLGADEATIAATQATFLRDGTAEILAHLEGRTEDGDD